MKTPIVTAAAFTLITAATAALSASAQPYQQPYPEPREQTRHETRFCDSLALFHGDAEAFRALGPHAPESAVRETARRVRDDADHVRDAASSMQTPAARDFDHAAERLRTDYDSTRENVSRRQSREMLQSDVQNLRAAAHQLAVESHCPRS